MSSSGSKTILFFGKKLFGDKPLHIALQRIPGLGRTLALQVGIAGPPLPPLPPSSVLHSSSPPSPSTLAIPHPRRQSPQVCEINGISQTVRVQDLSVQQLNRLTNFIQQVRDAAGTSSRHPHAH
jgi:hypothetical protein